MDPHLIDNPSLAATIYKNLVKERYLVSKYTNTSYADTGNISPLERQYIFEFVTDELERQKQAYEQLKDDHGGRRR